VKLEYQLHRFNHCVILNQHDIIDDGRQILQRLWHRNPHGDPIRNSIGCIRAPHRPFSKRKRHGWRRGGAYSYHTRRRRVRLHPSTDSGEQRAIAQRKNHDVEWLLPAAQLHRDASGTFRNGRLTAILYIAGASLLRKPRSVLFRRIEIAAN
jgi:hypothetical protein